MRNLKFEICNLQFAMSLFLIIALLLSCGGDQKEDGPLTLTIWQTYNDEENALFEEI